MDSTVLDDAVARQDTITQLIVGIRRFARDVTDGQELLSTHAQGYDYTSTGKPDIDRDDLEAKDWLVSAPVRRAVAAGSRSIPRLWTAKAADA